MQTLMKSTERDDCCLLTISSADHFIMFLVMYCSNVVYSKSNDFIFNR